MSKIDNKMVNEAESFVLKILDEKLSEKLLYHGKNHTVDVLKNAVIIGENSDLDEDDMNLLKISALFHDVGYIDVYEGHEEKSAMYATEFLRSRHVDDSSVKQVVDAILSTHYPQKPKDRISEILCDADLMYLADQSKYFEEAELLRQEWSNVGKTNMGDHEFYLASLDFFNSHDFHSEYGKQHLLPGKEKNESIINIRLVNIGYNSSV